MAQVRARAIEDGGEPIIPEFHHDAVVYAEHMVRYLFASGFVAGKTVLDVASGVGYGSDMLKVAGAAQVIGLLAEETISGHSASNRRRRGQRLAPAAAARDREGV